MTSLLFKCTDKTAQAYLNGSEICYLVYLYLCVELSAVLKYSSYFIGGDGINAATEGDKLNELNVAVLRRKACRTVKAGMVSPLIEHRHALRLCKVANAILTDHNESKACGKLIYSVSDLGVNVIRSARKHHNALAVRSCKCHSILSGFSYLCHISTVFAKSRLNSAFYLALLKSAKLT